MSQTIPSATTKTNTDARLEPTTSNRSSKYTRTKPTTVDTAADSLAFADVITEAQNDSLQIDLQETIAASQTGRLMRSNSHNQNRDTYETQAAIGKTQSDSKGPLEDLKLDQPQDSPTTRIGQHKTNNVRTPTSKQNFKSQEFLRSTITMDTSDVSRLASVNVFPAIANIINHYLRLPCIDRSINEKQLISTMSQSNKSYVNTQ